MIQPADLRARAETLAGPLPPLLAAAEHLAATVLLGQHGRRRPGTGDEFWQYRPAQTGDEMRMVDWRRSARSDQHFVREKEWQAAQSVVFWTDRSQSMQFASSGRVQAKSLTARTLALASAVLLVRGGERVGLSDRSLPPRAGELQLLRMAELLSAPDAEAEYGAPETRGMVANSRAVFLSDFLGDIDGVKAALTKAADRGVKGALVQILDPAEEAFPFDGRTIFESMGGTIRFESQKARDLKDRYLDRLAARKAELRALSQLTGWQYDVHHTDRSASAALLWLFQALERDH
ncbi:MAG: DUF58 domain-containing protein [Pseudomonadota bacterium]